MEYGFIIETPSIVYNEPRMDHENMSNAAGNVPCIRNENIGLIDTGIRDLAAIYEGRYYQIPRRVLGRWCTERRERGAISHCVDIKY